MDHAFPHPDDPDAAIALFERIQTDAHAMGLEGTEPPELQTTRMVYTPTIPHISYPCLLRYYPPSHPNTLLSTEDWYIFDIAVLDLSIDRIDRMPVYRSYIFAKDGIVWERIVETNRSQQLRHSEWEQGYAEMMATLLRTFWSLETAVKVCGQKITGVVLTYSPIVLPTLSPPRKKP